MSNTHIRGGIQEQLNRIPLLEEQVRGLQRLQRTIDETNDQLNQYMEDQQIDDNWVIQQGNPIHKWNHIKTYLTQIEWQIINNNNQLTIENEDIKATRQQIEDLTITIWNRIGTRIEQQTYFQKINQLKDAIEWTEEEQIDITNFEYI